MRRFFREKIVPAVSRTKPTPHGQETTHDQSIDVLVKKELPDNAEKKAAKRRVMHYKIFLLRQVTLPELVPRILDEAEEWATESSVLYIDPKDGFLEVAGPNARFGEQLVAFGPLTRLQASTLRAINFTIAGARRNPNPNRLVPGPPVVYYGIYSSADAEQYRKYIEILRTMDDQDFLNAVQYYRLPCEIVDLPRVTLRTSTCRYDLQHEHVSPQIHLLKEGDYVHLTAHCHDNGSGGANCVRLAKIEIQFAAWH